MGRIHSARWSCVLGIFFSNLTVSVVNAEELLHSSHSRSQISPETNNQILDQALGEANARQLTYLPEYITTTKRICDSQPGDKSCWPNLNSYILEIFACPTSPKRFAEALEHDDWILKNDILHGPIGSAPPSIQKLFNQLVQSLPQTPGRGFSIHWELLSYEGQFKNAHSLVGGKIVLSDALWNSESPLTDLEIAAVMAHEISHTQSYDSMTLGCLALEWTGSDRDVHHAQTDFFEDFRGSY